MSLVTNPVALALGLQEVQAVGELQVAHPIGQGRQVDPFLYVPSLQTQLVVTPGVRVALGTQREQVATELQMAQRGSVQGVHSWVVLSLV